MRSVLRPSAIAALVLAAAPFAATTDAVASPAPFTFSSPNTGWFAVPLGGVPLGDPANDAPTARDVVGDAASPMLFVASDATHVYFRLRVDQDPTQSSTNFAAVGWGCYLDLDADPTTYELATIVDGGANPDEISLFANTTTTTPDDPSEPPDLPSSSVVASPLTAAVGHAQVTAAASNFDGNPDFFVDWAVDRAVVEAAGYVPGQSVRFYCGSSSNGSNVDGDCSGGAAGNCPLSNQFSDPVTCVDSGCGVCGDGVISGGEACDDGGTIPGDRCSATCTVEITCAGAGNPCSAGVGACESTGVIGCVGATSVCSATPGSPSSEICGDAIDSDCDGDPDDGCPCTTDPCCAVDADCASGACDETAGLCVECTGDGDCTSGRCNVAIFECVECLDDPDCSNGEVCDQSTATCVAPKGCASDLNCAVGQICESRACVDGCRVGANAYCPDETTCEPAEAGNPVGSCEAEDEPPLRVYPQGTGLTCTSGRAPSSGASHALIALFAAAGAGLARRLRRRPD